MANGVVMPILARASTVSGSAPSAAKPFSAGDVAASASFALASGVSVVESVVRGLPFGAVASTDDGSGLAADRFALPRAAGPAGAPRNSGQRTGSGEASAAPSCPAYRAKGHVVAYGRIAA